MTNCPWPEPDAYGGTKHGLDFNFRAHNRFCEKYRVEKIQLCFFLLVKNCLGH